MAYNQNNHPSMPAPVRISIRTLTPTLFSDDARQAAQSCAAKEINKSTQLRRFYDELVMWHDKVYAKQDPAARKLVFEQVRPYIQMLRAKVAYAMGRRLINENFRSLFDSIVGQIQTVEDLRNARLFMEAFMGFKKYFEELSK